MVVVVKPSMESELSRNLMDKMSGITGQGYATAFDRAMQQYNLGRQQTNW